MAVTIRNTTQGIDLDYEGFDFEDVSIQQVNAIRMFIGEDTNIANGDSIELSQDGTGIFGGTVRSIESMDSGKYEVQIMGNDDEFERSRVQNTFSGVAVETMVKNGVENNTTWTVQTEATGQTVDEKEYDDTVSVLLRDAKKMTSFQLRVDTFNKTLYFEDTGSLNSGSPRQLETTGSNANIEVNSYKEDTTNTVDTVKVVGNVQRKTVTAETKTATAGQTTFTVNETPLIQVDEVRVNGTAQIKAVSGDTEAGDYYVEIIDGDTTGDIIFHEGLSSGDSVEIDYEYTTQPSAEVTDANAPAEGFKKVRVPSVTTDAEAQDAAQDILDRVSEPDIVAQVDYKQINFDIDAGETIELTDPTRDVSNVQAVIKKAIHSLPGTTSLEIGQVQTQMIQAMADSQRQNNNNDDQLFGGLFDKNKQGQFGEKSQWTATEGWHINNVNDQAKQQFVVYIPPKNLLRYIEMDLHRPQLTYDVTGGDTNESYGVVSNSGLTEDRNGAAYDNDFDAGHQNGLSEVTTPSATGEVIDMGSDSTSATVSQNDTISASFTAAPELGFNSSDVGNISAIVWNVVGDVNSADEYAVRTLVDSVVIQEETIRAGAARIFYRLPYLENIDGSTVEIFITKADSTGPDDITLNLSAVSNTKHNHTLYAGGSNTEEDTSNISIFPDDDQLNTDSNTDDHDGTNHDISFNQNDPSTAVGNDPGGKTVHIDVTPSGGSTVTAGAVTNFGQGGSEKVRLSTDDFNVGLNLVEVYNASDSDDIKIASLLRKALTSK